MNVEVQRLIKQEVDRHGAASGLTVERTLKELSRLAYSDSRRLFDANGKRIPIHALDDDTAAAVSGFEIEEEETTTTKGKRSTVASLVRKTKTKMWNKASALDMAMKYHKLYQYEGPPPGGTVIIIDGSALDEDI